MQQTHQNETAKTAAPAAAAAAAAAVPAAPAPVAAAAEAVAVSVAAAVAATITYRTAPLSPFRFLAHREKRGGKGGDGKEENKERQGEGERDSQRRNKRKPSPFSTKAERPGAFRLSSCPIKFSLSVPASSCCVHVLPAQLTLSFSHTHAHTHTSTLPLPPNPLLLLAFPLPPVIKMNASQRPQHRQLPTPPRAYPTFLLPLFYLHSAFTRGKLPVFTVLLPRGPPTRLTKTFTIHPLYV